MKASRARTYEGALELGIEDLLTMHDSLGPSHNPHASKCQCNRGIAVRVLKEMVNNIKQQKKIEKAHEENEA